MKKLTPTFILLILTTIFLNAQEIIIAPPSAAPDELISKPILPGCEEIQDKNGPEVESCFRKIMGAKITDRLMKKIDQVGEIGLDRLNSVVTLMITKEGKIDHVRIESANSAQFGKIVQEQMKQIAAKLPAITPAKTKYGNAANYIYRVPVNFVFVE